MEAHAGGRGGESTHAGAKGVGGRADLAVLQWNSAAGLRTNVLRTDVLQCVNVEMAGPRGRALTCGLRSNAN